MLVFCYVVWDASATTVGCVIEDKGWLFNASLNTD